MFVNLAHVFIGSIDPSICCEDLKVICEDGTDQSLIGRDFPELQGNFSLNRSTLRDLDDFFMEVCYFARLTQWIDVSL